MTQSDANQNVAHGLVSVVQQSGCPSQSVPLELSTPASASNCPSVHDFTDLTICSFRCSRRQPAACSHDFICIRCWAAKAVPDQSRHVHHRRQAMTHLLSARPASSAQAQKRPGSRLSKSGWDHCQLYEPGAALIRCSSAHPSTSVSSVRTDALAVHSLQFTCCPDDGSDKDEYLRVTTRMTWQMDHAASPRAFHTIGACLHNKASIELLLKQSAPD